MFAQQQSLWIRSFFKKCSLFLSTLWLRFSILKKFCKSFKHVFTMFFFNLDNCLKHIVPFFFFFCRRPATVRTPIPMTTKSTPWERDASHSASAVAQISYHNHGSYQSSTAQGNDSIPSWWRRRLNPDIIEAAALTAAANEKARVNPSRKRDQGAIIKDFEASDPVKS